MVRVLANGDVVPDDDVRGRKPNTSNRPTEQNTQRRQFGQVNQGGTPVAHGPTANIFDGFNERLIAMGIPRFNIGPYVIEPIVSVAFVVAFILMGLPGIMFAGILFLVSQWSQGGGQQQGTASSQHGASTSQYRAPPQGGGSSTGSSGHTWSGSGQRLGRS